MQMESEHLIHVKAKSERLICFARKCDTDEVLTFDPNEDEA